MLPETQEKPDLVILHITTDGCAPETDTGLHKQTISLKGGETNNLSTLLFPRTFMLII